DVRRERIEVAREAGFRVAQRLVAGAGVEVRIGHEARAAGEVTDLALEVLHLVEVVAPVQEALGASAAAQADGVAQAFAESRQVPGAPVAAAIIVAGGAAQVSVARESRVLRVVEEP